MPAQQSREPQPSATPDSGDELLQCRMVIVGLFSGALERDDRATYEGLKRSCLACSDRAPCEADLKNDPANPVWETYCPNADKLNALVARGQARP